MIVGSELHLPGRETPEKKQLEVLISAVSRLQNLLAVLVAQKWKWFLHREFSICSGFCNGISKTY